MREGEKVMKDVMLVRVSHFFRLKGNSASLYLGNDSKIQM